MLDLHRYASRVLPAPLSAAEASERARRLLSGTLAVVDCETTGLGDDARIVEIAIVDERGEVLLDSLVNPGVPIGAEATAIHGLTDADVAGAPSLWRLWTEMRVMFRRRRLVAYNAAFEARVLAAHLAALPAPPVFIEWECAMLLYAAWVGEIKPGRFEPDGRPRLTWFSLGQACEREEIRHAGAHRALADARATRDLLAAMAGRPAEEAPHQLALTL